MCEKQDAIRKIRKDNINRTKYKKAGSAVKQNKNAENLAVYIMYAARFFCVSAQEVFDGFFCDRVKKLPLAEGFCALGCGNLRCCQVVQEPSA